MLRKIIDNLKPHFSEGGRFAFLHSTFDAFETFLFVPDKVSRHGAHIRDAMDMKRQMVMVIIALLPVFFFGTYNADNLHYLAYGESKSIWDCFLFGFLQTLPMYVVSYGVGLAIEFAFAQVRKHEVNEGYLVSGMLIPLICPPDVPLWMLAIAVVFAVVIGKEVFGGTGMNIWNPALLARAFLFFAYPSQMSGDKIWIVSHKADAISGPTPLSILAEGKLDALPPIQDLFWGFIPGSIGETSAFCILLGAIILVFTGIASLRIMFSVVAGGVLTTLLFNAVAPSPDSALALDPLRQLLMGGFLFGTVFMATDPVTAAQTGLGKYIYGFLIGVLAILVRILNPAYPEGMMLAILFMNTFAPLIDYFIINRNINRRKRRWIQ